jgi:hypothetical protein
MNFYYNYPGDQILTENNSFANLWTSSTYIMNHKLVPKNT